MHHPMIAARVFDTPLLCHPAKAAAFLRGLGSRLVGKGVSVAEPMAFEDDDVEADDPRPGATLIGGDFAERLLASGYGYAIVDGIAIIGVSRKSRIPIFLQNF